MKEKGRGPARIFLPILLLAQVGLLPHTAVALPLNVTINTSALSGATASLAFDLIDGGGVNNNTVTISGFATNGALGSAVTIGGVSGSLPGLVTLTDTSFFNELLQGISLNSSVAFALDVTSNFAGGLPDAFSFFILDNTGTSSLVTTDLLGDALFTIDIDGSPVGKSSVASITNPSIPIAVTPQRTVPMPGTFLLLALGIGVLFWKGTHQPRRA